MKEIAQIVAEIFGLEYNSLFIKTRKREIVTARQVSMYVIKQKNQKISYTTIGDFFKKDHATVLHSIKTVENIMEYDKDFNSKVKIALHKSALLNYKKIVYVAHPISGDVENNVKKILEIVKSINFLCTDIIPFVPYLSDVLSLDDSIPEQRNKGINNNLYYFELGFINELWVYGNVISEGIEQEIKIAKSNGINVIFKN